MIYIIGRQADNSQFLQLGKNDFEFLQRRRKPIARIDAEGQGEQAHALGLSSGPIELGISLKKEARPNIVNSLLMMQKGSPDMCKFTHVQ